VQAGQPTRLVDRSFYHLWIPVKVGVENGPTPRVLRHDHSSARLSA